MNVAQILHSINVEDVLTVSSELEIKFAEDDLSFIENKIGDFIDWYSAIEFALEELQEKKSKDKND